MSNELESSTGWIIHQYPVRDHLLLLYILTPRRYFKAFYRVPKTKHGRQNPVSFCLYWISWKQSKQAINIQSLEFSETPFWFKNLKLFTGLYLNELIFNLCRPDELDSALHFYPIYESLLRHSDDCPINLLRHFEWQLLADCGYAIDFERTFEHQFMHDNQLYQFSPDIGFFESHDGYSGKDIKKIAQRNWDATALKILQQTLRKTIAHILDGKILQSRELLKEWLILKNQN
jgi:recombinational DNA repair protein (RecF pathway)